MPAAAAPELGPSRALDEAGKRHPAVAVRYAALDALVAQGDGAVARILRGVEAAPDDPARVTDAVVALRRIGTPAAREALARLRESSETARFTETLLDRGGHP